MVVVLVELPDDEPDKPDESDPFEDEDAGGGRGRRRRGTAVGAVEARALEHHAHGVEELAQPTAALGTDGQRVLAEALELLEGVAALLAGVLVGRHVGPLAATGQRRG